MTMDEFFHWLSEHGVELAALLFSIWSAWKSNKADKKAKQAEEKTKAAQSKAEKNEAELQRVKEDLVASEKYNQVKMVERLFEDALADLAVVTNENSTASIDEKTRAFLTASNRYTNLYNEINSFCTLINNGTIKAEGYIKTTARQKLTDYAEFQWQFYEQLNMIAIDNGLKKLQKPRYEAFKGYDEYLEKNLPDYKWNQIKQKRKKVGLT